MWMIKMASRRRIEEFEMTCYRKTRRILWTALKSNDSTLKKLGIDTRNQYLPIQKRVMKFFGHVIRKKWHGRADDPRLDGRRRERFFNRDIDQMVGLTQLPLPELLRRTENREA